jgi:integrase
MHRQCDGPFLFKSYASEDGCNGNSCSATLNKWLKQHVSDAVIHSFRHSFRDRLRNAGVQSEMIDQLGGWSRQSVGQGYGRGYSISVLNNAMNSLSENFTC